MKFKKINSRMWRLGATNILVEKVEEARWRLYAELDGKLYQGRRDFWTRKSAGQHWLKIAKDPTEFFTREVEKEVRRDLSFREELRSL